MGMIIRVAFNNQGWKGKCKQVKGNEEKFSYCIDKKIDVEYRRDRNGNCIGRCHEANLCKDYRWPNYRGKFDHHKIGSGSNVFFVYREPDGSYTLWGRAKVKDIEIDKRDNKEWLCFQPFEPLPEEKWVKIELSRVENSLTTLLKNWRQGRYRYLDEELEEKIKRMLAGQIGEILNAINTKPFIILSGISGMGKTQIARIISAGIVYEGFT